jgi:P-type E1-E2 ATPase
MTFMIVASPCAVVLATMPPLLSTIANAGRHGVLVTSAVALEKFGKTDLVAFDKTGTLTLGTPRVSEIESVRAAGPEHRPALVRSSRRTAQRAPARPRARGRCA